MGGPTVPGIFTMTVLPLVPIFPTEDKFKKKLVNEIFFPSRTGTRKVRSLLYARYSSLLRMNL